MNAMCDGSEAKDRTTNGDDDNCGGDTARAADDDTGHDADDGKRGRGGEGKGGRKERKEGTYYYTRSHYEGRRERAVWCRRTAGYAKRY